MQLVFYMIVVVVFEKFTIILRFITPFPISQFFLRRKLD